MIINTNRLASAAVAIWCSARIFERHGWEAALTVLLALTVVFSSIWTPQAWAESLRRSYAARHAVDRNRPQSSIAFGLIGWILLLLFASALLFSPGRPI